MMTLVPNITASESSVITASIFDQHGRLDFLPFLFCPFQLGMFQLPCSQALSRRAGRDGYTVPLSMFVIVAGIGLGDAATFLSRN